jgi:predicted transposase YdaD
VAWPTKTPHDAIFKSVFEKPEHAAAELQHILATTFVTS